MTKTFWRYDEKEINKVTEFLSKPPSRSYVTELENKFAEKFGVKYAISTNSGTSALDACMAAAGIKPGDEVIVPPMTFISTSFCAMYHGGVPVFADIDPETFTIDPKEIEKLITPRTKAIIPVSLYGLSPDMDPIMELAKKHNLIVIEDNAQCPLGKYKGKTVGTIGDMAIYSFERTKHMTSGDGGMIITNNPELAKEARKFAKLGYTTVTEDSKGNKPPRELMQNPDFKRHDAIGRNYRMPDVCAAILLSQLEKLDMFVETRQKIGKMYEEAVKGCSWLVPQKIPEEYESAYFTVALLLKDTKITWQEFRKAFIEEGGHKFYASWELSYKEPILLNKVYPYNNIRYLEGLCPVAESIQPNLIQLKTNSNDIEMIKQQCEALKRTIKKLER